MRLAIDTTHIEQIHAHARDAYPDECCGLMIGTFDGDICRTAELRSSSNDVSDPARRYVIDPLTYLHADRDARSRGMEVVGVYHSHPDAAPRPSRTDCDEGWPGYVYLIVQVDRGEPGPMAAWRFTDDGRAEAVGL